MTKKTIKSILGTCCIAIVFALFIRQNVFASVVVKSSTNIDNKYKIGDRALVNLLNKTPKVGDYVVFKYGNDNSLGKVTKINNDTIVINKSNKQFTIAKTDVKGIIFFKY
jgi:signal peptidase I